MSRTWKYKPRPKSSGTLDSIGGGHLLGAEDLSENNLRSLELMISYKDDIPQDMILVAREDKQKRSSSGTLDPIGGGNLVRIVDPEAEVGVSRVLESLFENQDVDLQNIIQLSGEDKSSQMAPNLDPIGGGNLVRNADSDTETEISRSMASSLQNQDVDLQNIVQLSGEDKSSQMAPNLDPIGGGNLVRNAHSDTEISRSVRSSLQNQDDINQDMILVAREDKQKTSSGTLDPIGGGNLVRIIDSDNNADVFRELESLLENQGVNLPNIVQLPGEDKSSQMAPNLDPLRGGNFVKNDDSDTETEISRSVGSSLQNQVKEIQDDTPQDMILVARVDKKKLSSSGTLDSIGGGNLVRIIDPANEADVFRELESLLENQDVNLPNIVQLSGEDKSSKMAPNLDPLGGGNLVRNADSNTETEISRSMGSSLHNQGRQNMMRLAREDKSMQRSSHALDGPYRGQIYRSLERSHLVDAGDQGGDVQRMLDSLSASDLLSLDSAERMAVVNALRSTHSKYPKRMLDSVSGWAFGESKRNFDEIDNVGFTGFAKRGPPRYKQLALAKKNFDEIDRAGFETYNKRDFDEIDRTGFDTFEKRDRKE